MSLYNATTDGSLERGACQANSVCLLERSDVLRDVYGRSRRGSFHSHSSL
jgi:hypothetical protein